MIKTISPDKRIRLFHGDCLDVMRKIPDQYIDLILCDPPYGTTANKWDNVLAFDVMWKEYERVLKPTGVIVLFGNQPFTSLLIASNTKLFRYSMIWKKEGPTGFLNAKYKPLSIYEDIMVFAFATVGSLSKNPIHYTPPGLVRVDIVKKNNPKSTWRKNKGYNTKTNSLNSDTEYKTTHTGYPTNILEFSRDKHAVHPTQKPVALLQYLIRMYSHKNAVVMDNTMGSGSTGVAALHTKRKFIGIEKDSKYYTIALNRIKGAYLETRKG